MTTRKTTVGKIDSGVLAFTVGRDTELDLALVDADCIGTAAHVTMLSKMPVKPALFSSAQATKVKAALLVIMADSRCGKFKITARDQDVHMAVERRLTKKLGSLGKKVHTGRSRNDQVALDLRLYARSQVLSTIESAAALAKTLAGIAKKHRKIPMVGRTHMQPAMPSSVGLWASSYAESLLDDIVLLIDAYEMNDQSPLGAAAGYGVPLPIDRELTTKLLGFSKPVHNVLHAINSRGKCESIILFAMAQAMLTLSRLSADLIIYTVPELGYFSLPQEYCTGSSIMPNKSNPDVLELVRAKAATVMGASHSVAEILRGMPGGYNRDLQETKAPFMQGIADTRASLSIVGHLVKGLEVNRNALVAGFTPEVFAADEALALVAKGVPFREAYDRVKEKLNDLEQQSPADAIAAKTHLGATAGLDFDSLSDRIKESRAFARDERRHYCRAISRLMGENYRE